MWLAMKLVVAQFCRAKDHEITNDSAECERSVNAMQFSHHHKLDTSLPLRSQSLGRCIAGHIPQQQIHANSKGGGLINEGGIISSDYGSYNYLNKQCVQS